MSAITVVVTAFDQGELVTDAVSSALGQTLPPREVIVVDDGSTDAASLAALDALARWDGVRLLRRTNGGVSAARNTGIAAAGTERVAVVDGDDELEPEFLARTAELLADEEVVAASSWLRLHGAVDTVARPAGGTAADFLARNACPATVLLRRSSWERAGGYDETMRAGFEDWDFFLSLLGPGGRIAVVPEPLIRYRTAPASANLRSMSARLERYGELVDTHRELFAAHLREVLLAHEAKAIDAAARWEHLMIAHPGEPLEEATYGDGGMAAAVRIATARAGG